MKHVILLLSFIFLFACFTPTFAEKTNTDKKEQSEVVNSQEIDSLKLAAQEVAVPEAEQDTTETEVEEFTGIVGGIVSIWNDGKADYKAKNPQGTQAKLLWFLTFIFGLLGTVKGTQIVRSWQWLKRLFDKNDIKTIVAMVSMIVGAIASFIVSGGNFDPMNFFSFASFMYIASDPIYNLMVGWGWINKTPKPELQPA